MIDSLMDSFEMLPCASEVKATHVSLAALSHSSIKGKQTRGSFHFSSTTCRNRTHLHFPQSALDICYTAHRVI